MKTKRIILFILALALVLSLCCACGATKEEKYMKKLNIQKVSDYLYTANFDDCLDYETAKQLMNELKYTPSLSCSSVRNGNFYGRNLDWYYNYDADFIVKLSASKDRKYASVGIVGNQSGITSTFVDSNEYSDKYKMLPYVIEDGINEKGVIMNYNVVPIVDLKEDITIKTIPTVEEREEILQSNLVRYVLDNFASASEAVDYLTKYVSVVPYNKLIEVGYDLHYMLADENETYLLEFYGGKIVVTNMTEGSGSNLAGKPYMTNFYLSYSALGDSNDIVFDEHGKVYENHDELVNKSGVTDYGAGTERYNLIVDNYESASTFDGMHELMKKLYYSNSDYRTGNLWYSELVGIEVNGKPLTVTSSLDDFEISIQRSNELYERATRDDDCLWQTTHSSIYNIAERSLTVYPQEQETGYTYKVE